MGASGVTDTVHLVRGVIEALTTASSAKTVVLAVDDVHLLDDLSTFVVHQIVHRRLAKVILTVRDGEPIPQAKLEIWKVDHVERLERYIAGSTSESNGDPHASQNRAPPRGTAPHDRHRAIADVTAHANGLK